MNLIKLLARHVVFPFTAISGINQKISNRSTNTGLVIMYHGITKINSNWFSPRHLSQEQFEEHILYLKKHFEIVSIDELVNHADVSPISKKRIAITFDDGYVNNLTVALPIIEKYEIPVTFFVSGICAEPVTKSYLFPDLIQALMNQKQDVLKDVYNEMGLQTEKGDFYSIAKLFDFEQRKQFESLLQKKLNCDEFMNTINPEIWRILSPSELQHFAKSKWVTIGSHGYNHFLLGEISEEQCMNELSKSKQALETCIGKPIHYLAYPDGNYSKRVYEMAIEAGYTHQFAVFSNLDFPVNQKDLFSRHGVSSTTTTYSCMFFIHHAFKKTGIK